MWLYGCVEGVFVMCVCLDMCVRVCGGVCACVGVWRVCMCRADEGACVYVVGVRACVGGIQIFLQVTLLLLIG